MVLGTPVLHKMYQTAVGGGGTGGDGCSYLERQAGVLGQSDLLIYFNQHTSLQQGQTSFGT